jgi:hypothetical protein
MTTSAERVRADESNGPELAASQLLYLLSKVLLCEPSRCQDAVVQQVIGVECTAAAVLTWQGD